MARAYPKPPGPSALTALGNVRRFLNHRAGFLLDLWQEYGDFFRFQMGYFDIYFINRPEWVKEVLMEHERFPKTPAMDLLTLVLGDGLLTSKGEVHRRQRRLMQPAFHKPRIAQYAAIMTRHGEAAADSWRNNEELDLHDAMMTLTMKIVAESLFSKRLDGGTERITEALHEILPVIDRIADPVGALKMKLPLPRTRRFERARDDLDGVIYGIIRERQAEGVDGGDLLSTLIAATDDEGDGKGMSATRLRDEVMTLFIAGHETTAVALSWTWYLLAQHREVEAQLHEELERVLGGRTPTFDDVPQLTYTRQILSESMRLYPPAYLIDRTPVADWDSGAFTIPKGKYIFMSPLTMGRHPEFYPDPERFDPDRWTEAEAAKRPRFAYFPFGGGPRVCIGEHFAWTEMILLVAIIAQRWQMTLLREGPAETQPLITLRPKDGIPVRLHARREAPALAAHSAT